MTLTNWRLWLGVGVSTAFLLFLIWTIDLDDLLRALREANYLYVIPAVVIYFVGVYFRAARWRYILSPLRAIPARRLYPVVVMGLRGNNVLPPGRGTGAPPTIWPSGSASAAAPPWPRLAWNGLRRPDPVRTQHYFRPGPAIAGVFGDLETSTARRHCPGRRPLGWPC